MLTPWSGIWATPLTVDGFGKSGGFEDGRGDVDDVMELLGSRLSSMPAGQWTMVPLRVPPQWEATCLVHW